MTRPVEGRVERIVSRALTFAAFMGLGFVLIRYVFGASQSLALSLAYIDATISIGVSDLKDRLQGGVTL